VARPVTRTVPPQTFIRTPDMVRSVRPVLDRTIMARTAARGPWGEGSSIVLTPETFARK
jgi:hypothetical protein